MADRSERRDRPERRDRLDQPRELRRARGPRRPDPERVGRLSDDLARFLGTWKFIGYMTAFIVVWVLLNTLLPTALRLDPYPLQFLTLLLSLQASYAAPLILLSQNRQADRDRVQYEQDRHLSEQSFAETEFLTRELASLRLSVNDVATRDFIRSELQRLADELADPSDDDAGGRDRPKKKGRKKRPGPGAAPARASGPAAVVPPRQDGGDVPAPAPGPAAVPPQQDGSAVPAALPAAAADGAPGPAA